jgi:amino-acid N-acetyltransferase
VDTLLPIHQGPRRLEVVRLLKESALPTADLADEQMADEQMADEQMMDFFYVGAAAAPIGVVGVQFCGADALLRSLVVSAAHRTQGLGKRLVEHAVYLLTTTAESFFRSRGYSVTPRDSAPAAIRSTPEFADLCPASSAFLSKRL